MIMVSFTVFTDADGGQESDYDFSELTANMMRVSMMLLIL